MSDPVTNVEIEDVLSSIRRLVSDEARKPAGRSATAAAVQHSDDKPDQTAPPSAEDSRWKQERAGLPGTSWLSQNAQDASKPETMPEQPSVAAPKPAPALILTPALRVEGDAEPQTAHGSEARTDEQDNPLSDAGSPLVLMPQDTQGSEHDDHGAHAAETARKEHDDPDAFQEVQHQSADDADAPSQGGDDEEVHAFAGAPERFDDEGHEPDQQSVDHRAWHNDHSDQGGEADHRETAQEAEQTTDQTTDQTTAPHSESEQQDAGEITGQTEQSQDSPQDQTTDLAQDHGTDEAAQAAGDDLEERDDAASGGDDDHTDTATDYGPDEAQTDQGSVQESEDAGGDPAQTTELSIEAKIAALEALVSDTGDQFEPDAEVAREQSLPWVDADAPRSVPDTSGTAPEEVSQDTQFDPAAMAFKRAHVEAVEDAAAQIELDVAETIGSDGAFLDEDMLRDMVADIVRQELQGPLGERITRNVRKLVRREIYRALAANELD